ncbi:uncharacterized protein EDB93DRAFT_1074956 [Suillus bovinus]|uniref:uncharacterized protein n=1 Tax=Suillus bovinus TaxID=48563 RepID=UPI001B88105E|nr:uncharacterized protein EDB93DRAFT_1074956 [Suillus bovinus]KAG2159464.1 hypothetical protein EDB93DRAFT_1074956 [Suillus bovinus]
MSSQRSDTLGHVLDVLKGSAIAEERGKDDNSKFRATYKKVSTEYDDDFLERANDDIAIILTFAGLFSAVNSTFIVGMQPDPGDTTNVLLLYLIQLNVDGPNSLPNVNTLSSSTDLDANACLAFSVLAAFGAVLGKQWLNSYKTARGRVTLEERGIERQTKSSALQLSAFCSMSALSSCRPCARTVLSRHQSRSYW